MKIQYVLMNRLGDLFLLGAEKNSDGKWNFTLEKQDEKITCISLEFGTKWGALHGGLDIIQEENLGIL